MAGQHGIQETREVLDAANALTLFIIGEVKKGRFKNVVTAIPLLVADGAASGVLGKLQAAVDGISNVPAEVEELDIDEVHELSKDALEDGFGVLAAIRAPAAQ